MTLTKQGTPVIQNNAADTIDGRLQAVEADVKELYKMVAQSKLGMPASFSKLTAEEKVLKTYQDVLALAKEMNIVLPR